MSAEGPKPLKKAPRLPRHVTVLGLVSLLTAMSSAMIYGLLPVLIVRVLGASMASVGLIEGTAEGVMSFAQIASGLASDWMGRRKPLVLLGYTVSAIDKIMFPLAGVVSSVFAARAIDRIGKGLRDAPRDAFMTDVTPGADPGLRLQFATHFLHCGIRHLAARGDGADGRER
jgi:MFS family permease